MDKRDLEVRILPMNNLNRLRKGVEEAASDSGRRPGSGSDDEGRQALFWMEVAADQESPQSTERMEAMLDPNAPSGSQSEDSPGVT